jgi:hypothetical protein
MGGKFNGYAGGRNAGALPKTPQKDFAYEGGR